MIASGKFVSNYINPEKELEEEQIQPAGVDLRIGKIVERKGESVIGDKEYEKPNNTEALKTKKENLPEKYENIIESNFVYKLPPGNYVVIYNEKIEIPQDHIGLVFPRSRLIRSGADIKTAVWDPGYKGKGEGQLEISNQTTIGGNSRIAQIIFIETRDVDEKYCGTHQGERL